MVQLIYSVDQRQEVNQMPNKSESKGRHQDQIYAEQNRSPSSERFSVVIARLWMQRQIMLNYAQGCQKAGSGKEDNSQERRLQKEVTIAYKLPLILCRA